MAVEAKRGCGYRKVGGLYLVSGELSAECDRLPFELSVCPCCGGGIKQARGWTWVQPFKLFEGTHKPCSCFGICPVCYPLQFFGETGKAGLLWIGEQHYPTVSEFVQEGLTQGISRRINSIPRQFEIGKTWVLLAHPKAVRRMSTKDEIRKNGLFINGETVEKPGIFAVFRPRRIERIVKQSEYETWLKLQNPENDGDYTEEDIKIHDKHQRDIDRGITLVPVPDDDKDHQ